MSEKIGQILVRRKIITEFDLNAAMERKAREPKKYLGQILCEMGLPQSKIIKGIYSPLGAMLVDNRTISAENYIHALSAHFSMPIVSLKDFTVLPAARHRRAICFEESHCRCENQSTESDRGCRGAKFIHF